MQGFLDVDGRRIINGNGEEITLAGWGLGNWLLCEGYMWLSEGAERFDRPRRIEAVVEELTGKKYADGFWKQYRDAYIAEEDLQMMAEMGYNSVRIPINARLFLQEGPGLRFLDTGFELLDLLVEWCEKHRLYAFIDLHGAPGGQTGANIDDSVDDVARLLLDQDCFDKGIALWQKIAERYKDRWIVGGYDLLNEPLRPVRHPGDIDQEYLLPKLKAFYEQCIDAIRQVDSRHLITLEGHHWATSLDVFCKQYDPKMVIHFHRYACIPDIECYRPFLEASQRWNAPLWLGETGENALEWFSAMYPMAAQLGIGFNLWPWKKMACENSPCSINVPKGWDRIIGYAKGGPHPGYLEAQRIFNEFLENIKIGNCRINEELAAYVFRTPGCRIRGTDFDELPGKGVSYLSRRGECSLADYRRLTGMEIVERFPHMEKAFYFDSRWRRFVLRLSPGEFACYSLYDITVQSRVEIHCYCDTASRLAVYQDDTLLGRFDLGALSEKQIIGRLRIANSPSSVIRLEAELGQVDIDAVVTMANSI